MNMYEVLRRPVVTEKSTMLGDQSQYVFEVARDANKIEIRQAVQEIFKVNVLAVNVLRVHPKMRTMSLGKSRGMTSGWKKAIVTLRAGERIELFQGV